MHKLDPIQTTKKRVHIWSKAQTDVSKGSGWGEEAPTVSPVPTSIPGPFAKSLAVCSVCAFGRLCVTDQVKKSPVFAWITRVQHKKSYSGVKLPVL